MATRLRLSIATMLLPLALLSTGAVAEDAAATATGSDTIDLIRSLQREWYVPRATELSHSAQLKPALQALCESTADKSETALERARQQWRTALASWEQLATVATGPLIERRSQRQIDFTPTRPRAIEKAAQAAPASLTDLERVGTPAKGFPALEWLLWVKPIKPDSAECRYGVLLAAEIEHESATLEQAFTKAATQQLSDEAANVALGELVNQWVGGVERLRWPNMEMPQRVAMTAKTRVEPEFPRHASASVAVSWSMQWQALRTLAVGKGISMEAALRARGKIKTAEAFAAAVAKTDANMQGLEPSQEMKILAAAKSLAALKRIVEEEVAPALGVAIGFSDADGD